MPVFIKGSVGDTLYVQLSDSPVSVSVELHPDIILDVDVSGTVVGIDLQNVSELIASAKELKGIHGIDPSNLVEETYSLLGQTQDAANSGRLVYTAS